MKKERKNDHEVKVKIYFFKFLFMIINEKRNLNYLLKSYKALQHNTMLIIHLKELFKQIINSISC